MPPAPWISLHTEAVTPCNACRRIRAVLLGKRAESRLFSEWMEEWAEGGREWVSAGVRREKSAFRCAFLTSSTQQNEEEEQEEEGIALTVLKYYLGGGGAVAVAAAAALGNFPARHARWVSLSVRSFLRPSFVRPRKKKVSVRVTLFLSSSFSLWRRRRRRRRRRRKCAKRRTWLAVGPTTQIPSLVIQTRGRSDLEQSWIHWISLSTWDLGVLSVNRGPKIFKIYLKYL